MKLRLLNSKELRQALPMADAIEAMADAYSQLSSGKAQVPLRSRLEVAQAQGVSLLMPAYLPETQEMAVKVVSVFPKNAEKNLPTIHAAVLALDPDTGQPIALIEGGSLTALRTGAASGLATRLLAKEQANSVGIFGAGIQARTQLEAVCTARSIEKAFVYSPDEEGAQRFAAEMAGRTPVPADIQVANEPETLLQADILCTATTSSTPVFPGENLLPGTHINAIGSFTPQMEEVDLDTITRATVFVDSREAALEEAGDLLGPIRRGEFSAEDIAAEIGEVILGQAPGRTSPQEITYFKSVGVAVQDAVAAGRAIRRAAEAGLGTMVDL
jgi:ornithine cyclodeaminase